MSFRKTPILSQRLRRRTRELNVARSTSYRLIDSGELGSVYVIGRLKKIEADGVEAYIQRCKDADVALVE